MAEPTRPMSARGNSADCRLGDWLKLEDINNSLFLVTCDRKARAYKPPGTRQPRYLKFFQVRSNVSRSASEQRNRAARRAPDPLPQLFQVRVGILVKTASL